MGRKRRVGLVYVDSNCVHRVQHGKWHLGKHGHAKSQRPTTKTYSRFFVVDQVGSWEMFISGTKFFASQKFIFSKYFSFDTKVKLESKTKYRWFSIRCVLYTIFSKNEKPLTLWFTFRKRSKCFWKNEKIIVFFSVIFHPLCFVHDFPKKFDLSDKWFQKMSEPENFIFSFKRFSIDHISAGIFCVINCF